MAQGAAENNRAVCWQLEEFSAGCGFWENGMISTPGHLSIPVGTPRAVLSWRATAEA